MKLSFPIFLLLLVVSYSQMACLEPVEGCTNPRAQNFNPEADVNLDCNYYQLQLEMQYTTNGLDTFEYGTLLTDADGTPFVLNKMPILISQMHLIETSSNEVQQSPELLSVFNSSGERRYTEDNFGILRPTAYQINMAGWTALSDYDTLEFLVGVSSDVRNTNPAQIEESGHPLSTSASTYMYDSTSNQYLTSIAAVVLTQSGQQITTKLFSEQMIRLPYQITSIDGQNVPIKIRLNYAALFAGVSFSRDTEAVIVDKIEQNMPRAFSTF